MSGEVLMDAGEHGVVHVTLRHAGRLNAMSRAMWRQLRAVFDDIQRRSDVRCVLIAGEGGAFCAGGDISEYPGFRFDATALRDFHENDVWGGLHASCCDVRIAGSAARFGAPIAKLGFPMAPREAQLVAGAVGDVTARQMLLEAATFSAGDMLARGFLSSVVPDDLAATQALGSALRIAALAPQAARLNKQTLRALNWPLAMAGKTPAAAENGAGAVPDPYAYANSAEHREGITAFLEKRAPVF